MWDDGESRILSAPSLVALPLPIFALQVPFAILGAWVYDLHEHTPRMVEPHGVPTVEAEMSREWTISGPLWRSGPIQLTGLDLNVLQIHRK